MFKEDYTSRWILEESGKKKDFEIELLETDALFQIFTFKDISILDSKVFDDESKVKIEFSTSPTKDKKNNNSNTKPSLLSSCYAFRPKSEVVKRLWPAWYKK